MYQADKTDEGYDPIKEALDKKKMYKPAEDVNARKPRFLKHG